MANGSSKKKRVRRRPAVPRPVRVRRNINSLGTSHPIVVFYSRAIGEMKAKPITDPTSWRYQAAIHDYPEEGATFAQDRLEDDPFATAAETLPPAAERNRFWRRCQHGTWFFLPWHRMYLHHFERIIMGHVARLGGPSNCWKPASRRAAGCRWLR
jgi:tyrosinase